MGLSGQHHAPASLYPGERTHGTHCTGSWVGPRAGPDTEVREKNNFYCLDTEARENIISLPT